MGDGGDAMNGNPRDRLLGLVDSQIVDARHALLCCVKWLSWDDCTEIMRINELEDKELE